MNTGKIFEQNFKLSVPREFYYLRLKDPAVGFTGGASSFAVSNPFDCLIYTGKYLHCLELKSKNGSITYWRQDFEEDGKKHTFEIKKHQIQGLQKAAAYDHVKAGILINFRHKDETWYAPIDSFIKYTAELPKKSLNTDDMPKMGCIPVSVRKLKVNERYDVAELMGVVESGS